MTEQHQNKSDDEDDLYIFDAENEQSTKKSTKRMLRETSDNENDNLKARRQAESDDEIRELLSEAEAVAPQTTAERSKRSRETSESENEAEKVHRLTESVDEVLETFAPPPAAAERPRRANAGKRKQRLAESDSEMPQLGKRRTPKKKTQTKKKNAPVMEEDQVEEVLTQQSPPPPPPPSPPKPATPTKTTELKVMGINVKGALSSNAELLETFIVHHHPDVLVISETGLSKFNARHLGKISQYTASHVISPTRNLHRGISIYVADKWVSFIEPANMDTEKNDKLCVVRICIKLKKWHLQIFGVYGNHEKSAKYWNEVQEWITPRIKASDRVIMIGDMNVAPNPLLDRIPEKQDKPCTKRKAFLEMMEAMHLIDIWREKHGSKVDTTWHKHNQQSNAQSRSRIDLVLVSEHLRELSESCEILEEWATLTTDHHPIEYIMTLPDPIENMPSMSSPPPEMQVEQFDVAKLKDETMRTEYANGFTDEKLAPIMNEQDPQRAYTAFAKLITEVASETIGKKMRIINKRQKQRKPTPDELTRGHCASVLRSEPYLMREVKNGHKLRKTEAIEKLINNAPRDALPDFPDTNNRETAALWFIQVQRLERRLTEELTKRETTRRGQKILDAIERRNNNELCSPSQFYNAVRALKDETKSKKIQMAFINEVDPEYPNQLEKSEPEEHKKAMSKYYEFAGQIRIVRNASYDKPWFNEKFKSHRERVAKKNEDKEILMKPITQEELDNVLRALPNEKAAGPDEIRGELLKALPENARKVMSVIFSRFLATQTTPR